MRILLDCRFQKGAGPNVTTAYLAERLLALGRQHEYVVLLHKRQDLAIPGDVRKIFVPARNRLAEFLWVQTILPLVLRHEGIDIYHSLKHFGPLWTSRPVILPVRAVSQFLEGMQKLSTVDRLYWRRVGSLAWRRASRILAVSSVCRDYLVDHLKIPPERVRVLHHGVHDRFHPGPPDRELLGRLGVVPPYVLWVGNLYAHKNCETAIRAVAAVRASLPEAGDLRLVVVGDRSFAEPSVYDILRECRIEEAVHFTGFLAHADLVHLYRGAEALLFCSIYEAFPNPVLEAMASGLPVVAAARGAVPEVAGDAAILVQDPMDAEAFARALGRVRTDPEQRAAMIQRGLTRASAFRWDETAKRVLEVYEEIGRSVRDRG